MGVKRRQAATCHDDRAHQLNTHPRHGERRTRAAAPGLFGYQPVGSASKPGSRRAPPRPRRGPGKRAGRPSWQRAQDRHRSGKQRAGSPRRGGSSATVSSFPQRSRLRLCPIMWTATTTCGGDVDATPLSVGNYIAGIMGEGQLRYAVSEAGPGWFEVGEPAGAAFALQRRPRPYTRCTGRRGPVLSGLVHPAREGGDGPMSRRERHVVPNSDGGWDVVAPGGARRSSHHGTQADAIDRARTIVGNSGGGEIVIHGRDGRIRDSDTVPPGNDPNPPRDRR